MCGIVGYLGNKSAKDIIIKGLKRLEYRGYDSSGLLVLSKNNSFLRARSVGNVHNLEKNLNSRKIRIKGNIGIAHTRWATHGEPANRNAHQQISNNAVAITHNGII